MTKTVNYKQETLAKTVNFERDVLPETVNFERGVVALKSLHYDGYTHEQYRPPTLFQVPEEDKSLAGKRVTEEEYWETYYNYPDRSYEYNDGYLEEKPVPDLKSAFLYRWFMQLLEQFLAENPIADLITLDVGFRMNLAGKIKVRKPDISLVVKNNPVAILSEDAHYKGTFDLCIEVLSYSHKSDIVRDTVTKKNEYQQGVVKEYYILDARRKETAFYRLNNRGVYTPIPEKQDGIIDSVVLPGFRFRVKDLYERPGKELMREDPVYSSFVEVAWQKEAKLREEAEADRAKEAKLREEAEADRAKEAKLREEAEADRAKAEAKAELEAKLREEAEAKVQLEARRKELVFANAIKLLTEVGLSPEEAAKRLSLLS